MRRSASSISKPNTIWYYGIPCLASQQRNPNNLIPVELYNLKRTGWCKSKNRETYEKWIEIQDLNGPASKWPFSIRKLFWQQNIKHFERLFVAVFVYVNGLNPSIFLEWARLNSRCRDETGYKHFEDLLKLFDGRKYKLYAYHVGKQQV